MCEQQIEHAKKCLSALQKELDEIKKVQDRKVNIFDAAGMTTQEIKHSHFFAWLLDPKKPHGLGTTVLDAFITRLLAYQSDEKIGAKPNSEILQPHIAALQTFGADENIAVATEKILLDKESRMDIYIESPKTKTALVIENKVFTGTHDNQLARYENELSGFDGWHKIFVYLTPFGELPTDPNGDYNENWCIFDYSAVLRIIKDFLKILPKKKENAKLKILMEDYIELVETNILNENKELRDLCKKIRREHEEALQILNSYTDSAEEIIAYCKTWLKNNYDDICFVMSDRKKMSFGFYTKTLEAFFVKQGERFIDEDGLIKCAYGISGCDRSIDGAYSLYKNREANWSPAQEQIMQMVAPNKKRGNLFFSFLQQSFLSEEARYGEFGENAKAEINAQLQILMKKLQDFDDRLKTL